MKQETYYILTTAWFDSGAQNIIKLCLTGESGYAEALINNKPVFFGPGTVSELDLPGLYKIKSVELKSLSGEPLNALYFNTQSDLRRGAQLLEEKGIATYESDIDPVKRYLMEKSIYCAVSLTGESIVVNGIKTYVNPNLEPADYFPDLKIASIDIETGIKNTQLYCIGVHITGKGSEEAKVFMHGAGKNSDTVIFLKDEKSVLIEFLNYLNASDPDVITGWHVIGFDLAFLEMKYRKYDISFALGRGNTTDISKFRRGRGYFASVHGRLIIDAPSALRSVFFSYDDYKLETVAQKVLGEGKLLGPGPDKVEQIEKYYTEDKFKLAEYNIQDAVLVSKILKKTGVIDLYLRRSIISGLTIEQAGMMTAAFDHVYLPKFHKRGYAAPDVKDIRLTRHAAGGYVMDPPPGIFENVIVLDFKSLYPSIIMTFKIDPLSRLMAFVNPLNTPVNIQFSSTEHILPEFIMKLMEQRMEAKRNKDKPLSIAIKLLMNSFYGVMGSSGCRFYHPDLPSGITGTGQYLLLGSRSFLEEKGYKVIYGDTDSLFVALGNRANTDYRNLGGELAGRLNEFWKQELKAKFNVESYLEIEYEKYYRKFIITPARGSESGAKKRYAGLIEDGGKETIEFTGMESIRSDWTKAAKEFQAGLYKRIFNGSEVEEWVREFIVSIKNGSMDEKLVYRKRIRKNIEEYRNLPPQIKAAKLLQNTGSVIRYVMTMRGPLPVEMEHKDLDYQHYIEKQIKPIADSVLLLLGKSFDSIVNPYQYDMFN